MSTDAATSDPAGTPPPHTPLEEAIEAASGYRVQGFAGEGDFARVLRCSHVDRPGELYALKSVLKSHSHVADVVREEEVLRALPLCEHIPRYIESIETEEATCLVTTWADGTELYEDLRRRNQYSEAAASAILRGLCEALRALHGLGIVHSDVKLENIVVKPSLDGDDMSVSVKLIDYGFARVLETPNSLITELNGSPHYIAPEGLKVLFLEKGGFGCQLDMWAAGVVLFTLLCGFFPFDSDEDMELFRSIMECDYAFQGEEWDGVSETAKDLIVHLLDEDPNSRYTAEQALKHPFLKATTREDSAARLFMSKCQLSKRPPILRRTRGAVHAVSFIRAVRKKHMPAHKDRHLEVCALEHADSIGDMMAIIEKERELTPHASRKHVVGFDESLALDIEGGGSDASQTQTEGTTTNTATDTELDASGGVADGDDSLGVSVGEPEPAAVQPTQTDNGGSVVEGGGGGGEHTENGTHADEDCSAQTAADTREDVPASVSETTDNNDNSNESERGDTATNTAPPAPGASANGALANASDSIDTLTDVPAATTTTTTTTTVVGDVGAQASDDASGVAAESEPGTQSQVVDAQPTVNGDNSEAPEQVMSESVDVLTDVVANQAEAPGETDV